MEAVRAGRRKNVDDEGSQGDEELDLEAQRQWTETQWSGYRERAGTKRQNGLKHRLAEAEASI